MCRKTDFWTQRLKDNRFVFRLKGWKTTDFLTQRLEDRLLDSKVGVGVIWYHLFAWVIAVVDSFCRLTLFPSAKAVSRFDWVNSKNNVSQLCYFGQTLLLGVFENRHSVYLVKC